MIYNVHVIVLTADEFYAVHEFTKVPSSRCDKSVIGKGKVLMTQRYLLFFIYFYSLIQKKGFAAHRYLPYACRKATSVEERLTITLW